LTPGQIIRNAEIAAENAVDMAARKVEREELKNLEEKLATVQAAVDDHKRKIAGITARIDKRSEEIARV